VTEPLFTIGFTQKSAEHFFSLLSNAGVERVVDIRLNNVSQLAGFAKKRDLAYFLKAIVGIDYVHVPLLAPTAEILDDYKKRGGDWLMYEKKFNALLSERRVESRVEPDLLKRGCLLCSEHEPDRCHRRLVAEYLQPKLGISEIRHLL
jgi:uncharacterized protein (DUF488 family)